MHGTHPTPHLVPSVPPGGPEASAGSNARRATRPPGGARERGRARGVYEEDDPPEGVVVVRVYNARRRRIIRTEIAADYYTAATHDAFVAWLDLMDPVAAAPRAPLFRLG